MNCIVFIVQNIKATSRQVYHISFAWSLDTLPLWQTDGIAIRKSTDIPPKCATHKVIKRNHLVVNTCEVLFQAWTTAGCTGIPSIPHRHANAEDDSKVRSTNMLGTAVLLYFYLLCRKAAAFENETTYGHDENMYEHINYPKVRYYTLTGCCIKNGRMSRTNHREGYVEVHASLLADRVRTCFCNAQKV